LTAANAGRCPQCGEPKAAHRVCAYCGYYRARQVRPVDEE
jgi:ribosomal protein L32